MRLNLRMDNLIHLCKIADKKKLCLLVCVLATQGPHTRTFYNKKNNRNALGVMHLLQYGTFFLNVITLHLLERNILILILLNSCLLMYLLIMSFSSKKRSVFSTNYNYYMYKGNIIFLTCFKHIFILSSFSVQAKKWHSCQISQCVVRY